ncbi:MAG: single-stranded-DNA-specific exonuclease RecJ [Candidatus Omnitrophica bacterium]|nr:single-stranded-DNA-specific exonuclease RecJ [Candidatus Omnitrophota bacterium]
MEKFWRVAEPAQALIDHLSRVLGIAPLVAALLVNRGLDDPEQARDFLFPDLIDLHDPFLFKDMKKIVARIHEARQTNERVLIFGDYDVDGVTSCAVLYKVLTGMGLEVINHIPHRVDDGYGLSCGIGEFARENKITLMIAVDCGVTAFAAVEYFNSLGMEVIIIDHHEPDSRQLPNAFAIIDPKISNSGYPFRDLAAVGLAAKVAEALTGKRDAEIMDLTTLGTVADVVPLKGENRIIVKHGLGRMARTANYGLAALMELAKLNTKKLTPYHIGFVLGPRINAAGRMDSAHSSLDLFLSETPDTAFALARELEAHNQERQKTQRAIVQEAIAIVEESGRFQEDKVIVLSKEGWHKGILGIVASKISEKYYRPAIVISLKDGIGTASGRSVDGFHLQKALQSCAACLDAFGGHEGAAGLTIRAENIDPFRDLINQVAADVLIRNKMTPTLDIDGQVELSRINMDLVKMVETMEPFGEGNPSPVFCSTQLRLKGAPRVLAKDTLKFWVTDGQVSLSAVGFGMGKYASLLAAQPQFDLAYEAAIDDWNKPPSVQLVIKDIRFA